MKKNVDHEFITAYAKIKFKQEKYSYYLQCLTVNIGRRTKNNINNIDIDLGKSKSISRLHAIINYDFEKELFVLHVLSINGLWIEGLWYGKGAKIELGKKTKIQIDMKIFYFVLPSEIYSNNTNDFSQSASISNGIQQPISNPIKPVNNPVNNINNINNINSKLLNFNNHKFSIPLFPQATDKTFQNFKRPNVAYTTLINRELQDAPNNTLSVVQICIKLMQKYDWFNINKESGWQVRFLI